MQTIEAMPRARSAWSAGEQASICRLTLATAHVLPNRPDAKPDLNSVRAREIGRVAAAAFGRIKARAIEHGVLAQRFA